MANVLIVSTNGFSKVNCNKTYESIFSGFEKEQLYSFFTRPQDAHLDFGYCGSYYAVSESDIIRSLLKPQGECGSTIASQQVDQEETNTNRAPSLIYNFFKSFQSLKQNLFFKDFLWNTYKWWTKDLRDWLKSTNTDVIFFHDPGIISFHKVLYKIADYLNVPIVYYITDDYYKYYTETWLQRQYLKRLLPICKRTLQQSAQCYCVGELMANEYEDLFGVHFDTIMNSAKISKNKAIVSDHFKIASYFGGLHLDRWKMLSRFADLFDGELRIFTATPIDDNMKVAFEKDNIKLMGCVYDDKLEESMENTDILLHIESDDVKFMQRTRLAVSTKIPEYLSTGKLTIGYGHPDLASMKILSDNNIGIVVDSRLSKDDAINVLQQGLNKKHAQTVIDNAIKYVNDNFNEEIVSNHLKTTIETIAKTKNTKK